MSRIVRHLWERMGKLPDYFRTTSPHRRSSHQGLYIDLASHRLPLASTPSCSKEPLLPPPFRPFNGRGTSCWSLRAATWERDGEQRAHQVANPCDISPLWYFVSLRQWPELQLTLPPTCVLVHNIAICLGNVFATCHAMLYICY